jgi:hypothetical protein
MEQTLELSLLGLDQEFPGTLYVLRHPPSEKYGCYCHKGVHGLACFSLEGGAQAFAEWIDLSGMQCVETSFDEAREIAKARPMPVVSIMLLDNFEDPEIHYVR